MRKFVLILGLICFLFVSLLGKKVDEVVFESVLKDAIFVPCPTSANNNLEPRFSGCWTLKFENNAVIRVYPGLVIDKDGSSPSSSLANFPTDDTLWIGKKYRVSIWKKLDQFYVTLMEEIEQAEKKEISK